MHSDEPHAHAHHTGHRWLDIVLGLGAIFISLVSLFVAIEDSRAMRNMAQQNARLVTANSWPFLQYRGGNLSPEGKSEIRIGIENTGVGPARVRSLEMWWRGHPVSGNANLLELCCGYIPPPPDARADTKVNWWVGIAVGHVIRPGETADVFKIEDTPVNDAVWRRFNLERLNLSFRGCFCSVFDDCWVSPLQGVDATPVKTCPKPIVPYGVLAPPLTK